jgi:predicted nucleic acid-binding protein
VIILDTNVLSELMKASPDVEVVRWVTGQPASSLYITSITQAEILHGIMLLPTGKRRNAIQSAAEAMFSTEFDGRILAFDSAAARPYATIAAERRSSGRPISQFDAQIAAIAHCARAAIATRNVDDFDSCGIRVVNPWRR